MRSSCCAKYNKRLSTASPSKKLSKMSMITKKSMYYNHPEWPSPRAVLFVRKLAGWGYVKKPAGRLTHDIALGILSDKLGMTVPLFLRDITPISLLNRIGANNACYAPLLGAHAASCWFYNLPRYRYLPLTHRFESIPEEKTEEN